MRYLDNHEVQFELSNPQYGPDDSAPPVPNISVDNFIEGTTAIEEGDYVSMYEDWAPHPGFRVPNDTTHFHGIPNTRSTDSVSGVSKTTGDHILWSHLNVDGYAPSFTIYDDRSLETYEREFLPAAGGLFNVRQQGSGITVFHSHVAHNLENSFAVQGGTNAFMPETYSTLIFGDVQRSFNANIFSEQKNIIRNFEVVDFYIRVKKEYVFGQRGESRIGLFIPGYEFAFFSRILNDNDFGEEFIVGAHIWKVDRSGDTVVDIKSGYAMSINVANRPDIDPEFGEFVNFVLRFEIYKGTQDYGVFAGTDGHTIQVYSQATKFYPDWDNNPFDIEHIFASRGLNNNNPGDYVVPMSVQCVGYPSRNDVPVLEESMRNVYPSPHEFYYPIIGSYDPLQSVERYPKIIQNYSGNLWEYLNKVATSNPFSRKIN